MEVNKEPQLVELNEKFKRFLMVPGNVDLAAENVLEELVDEVVLGYVYDVHRAAKLGYLVLEEGVVEEQDKIVDDPNLDIFGQSPVKKQHECVCPSCHRNLAASRFAPHLEKCMGMGRNSSRIASRRIANNSKENAYGGMMSDDDDDADWTAGSDRRRKKRDKNGSKKSKNQKVRNGDVSSHDTSDINNMALNYESMSNEDRRHLLSQICGVISEHTKKLCTRSQRCPQHTDDQRRAVRLTLLHDPPTILEEVNNTSMTENVQVDVDTYEEGDGQVVRETLGKSWEQENSNNSSPADSTSTSSSSSKKREKSSKSKKKGSPKGYKMAGAAFQGNGLQPMVE